MDIAEKVYAEENTLRQQRKKKIAVIGIGRGAGATFIASSLAFLLSKFVEEEKRCAQNLQRETVVRRSPVHRFLGQHTHAAMTDMPTCTAYVEQRAAEAGETRFYHAIGLDRVLGSRRFVDFFSLLADGQPITGQINLHKGVNWVVHDAAALRGGMPIGRLSELAGQYIISDGLPTGRRLGWEKERPFGLPGVFPHKTVGPTDAHTVFLDSLQRFDLVIGVIDPLPARLFAGAEIYACLRERQQTGLPVLWLLNKDSAAVNHREVCRFLQLKRPDLTVPLFPAETIYQSQFQASLPAELLLAKGEGDALRQLVQRVRAQVEADKRSVALEEKTL